MIPKINDLDAYKLASPGENETCFRCECELVNESCYEETDNNNFLCNECFDKTCEVCDKADHDGDGVCSDCILEGQIMAADLLSDSIKEDGR